MTLHLQMLPSANELPFGEWMPTLRSVSSPTATVPAAFDVEPNRSGSTWHCLNCESADAEPVLGGWQCTQCGSQEFYDPNLPLRSVTARGTWMYMPHGSPEMASPSSSASASSQASRRRRRRRGPPSGNPESDAGERAESEAPTVDPIVVPSEHDFPRSPQVYHGQHVPQGPLGQPGPVVPLVDEPGVPHAPSGRMTPSHGGRRLGMTPNRSSADDDADEWDSRRGPEPGVRWRSGQWPTPPVWKYDCNDLRAYSKYCKKVQIWEIQLRSFATKREQALLLYNSLTGDAEQELEHVNIEEIYNDKGIEIILQKLKTPFEQRSIFQKRKYLHEYETLRRYPGELIRTYISRFRRSIRNLRAVGVDVTATYDGEALGSRLLDRSGLTVESQRLVLIGTSQSLELETVAEALTLQYPDFRGAPPIAGRDGKGAPKGSKSSTSSSTASSLGKGSSTSSRSASPL